MGGGSKSRTPFSPQQPSFLVSMAELAGAPLAALVGTPEEEGSTALRLTRPFLARSVTSDITHRNPHGLVSLPPPPKTSPTSAPPAAMPDNFFNLGKMPGKLVPPAPFSSGVLLSVVFPVSVRQINRALFAPDSEVFTNWRKKAQHLRMEAEPWMNHGGAYIRTLRFTQLPQMPKMLHGLFKPIQVEEKQEYIFSDGGFVVETESLMHARWLRSLYVVRRQFCMTQEPGVPGIDMGTRLRVSWQVRSLHTTLPDFVGEYVEDRFERSLLGDMVDELCSIAHPVVVPQRPHILPYEKVSTSQHTNRVHLAEFIFFVAVLGILSLLQYITRKMNRKSIVKKHAAAAALLEEGAVIEVGRSLFDFADSWQEVVWTLAFAFFAYRLFLTLQKSHPEIFGKFAVGDVGRYSQGVGWVVSVVVVEATDLRGADFTSLSDPFVELVLGKQHRQTSVKVQTLQPRWGEVLEFDALEEPPSRLSVRVKDYDGPFRKPDELGTAEVDLMDTATNLGEMWVNLHDPALQLQVENGLAKTPRVHLRVSIINNMPTSGAERFLDGSSPATSKTLVSSLLPKLKKSNANDESAAKRNRFFQSLFDLGESEVLVKDFRCAIKKIFNVQGRLFLSPRVVGFYSNMFGKKTKFTVLWEDVEDMEQNGASVNLINRMLNPAITLFVRAEKSGPGSQASLGSFGNDRRGRARIRFTSFGSPSLTFNIMELLWKNRTSGGGACLDKLEKMLEEVDTQGAEQVLDDSTLIDTSTNSSFHGSESSSALRTPTSVTESSLSVSPFPEAWQEQVLELADEVEVPLHWDVFYLMYTGEETERQFAIRAGLKNWKASPWVVDEDTGREIRTVAYDAPNQNPMCPPHTPVTVRQSRFGHPTEGGKPSLTVEEVFTTDYLPLHGMFMVETRQEIVASERAVTWQLFVGVKVEGPPMLQEQIKRKSIRVHTNMLHDFAEVVRRHGYLNKKRRTSFSGS
eukprot:jgi/Mesvir1/24564/Mv21897-RA.2